VALARMINVSISVAGTDLPASAFKVTDSSQGEFSTANISSSIAAWRIQGVEIPKKDDAVDIHAGLDGLDHLFSGVVDDVRFKWDRDTVEISCRDLGAVLNQSKLVLSKYDFKNQTIGKIVKQVAEDFGLDTDIKDPGIMAGSEQHGEHQYLPSADNPWSLFQDLARQVGYAVKVDKDNVLSFKPPEESGGGTLTVTYGGDPKNNPKNPIKDLETTYQLARNGDVKVKVVSYHPTKAQKVSSEATAKGKEPSGGNKRYTASGQPKKTRKTRKTKSTKANKTPTVTIRRDGLTQEQADELAKATAKDIAKKQIIMSGTIEMKPVKIHSKLKVKCVSVDILGFDAIEYCISQVVHSWDMPEEGGSSGGLFTEITAQLRPEVS